MKQNLLNFNEESLRQFLVENGEAPYRAVQLLQWIHCEGLTDFAQMTNISKKLQEKLANIAEIVVPTIKHRQDSKDGTIKWLLQLSCNNSVETVYIPEDGRGTLCVSSQVGCSLNCQFCSTAKQGFNRNLSTAEIIGQVWIAARELSHSNGKHDRAITNVVMMGMGEPLLNLDAVIPAMDIMLHDYCYNLAQKRVTLSTAGVVPKMEILRAKSPVALAVSLHAPNNKIRNEIVPLNKKYPLEELIPICRDYFKDKKRVVTFEYVMLDGVNDEKEHAIELAKLLKDVPCKINLIPFNPFPNAPYKCSSKEKIDVFRDILIRKGLNTITRKTRGDDIDAACGQLAGKIQDRTSRSKRWQDSIEKH